MSPQSSDAPPRPLCCACGEPILAGQPRWAGDPELKPWHYACAEANGLAATVTSRPSVWFGVGPDGA